MSQSESEYIGEPCRNCKDIRLIHPSLYSFQCPHCGFSYRVNPANKKEIITITNQGKKEVKT